MGEPGTRVYLTGGEQLEVEDRNPRSVGRFGDKRHFAVRDYI